MKVSVILCPEEAERLSKYCQKFGYKKSTLIARLIRQHIDQECFEVKDSEVNSVEQKAMQND